MIRTHLATHISRSIVLLLAVLAGSTLSGCATARSMMSRKPIDAMAGAPRFANTNFPTKESVVDHINQNIDSIRGWQANKVKIQVSGISIPLKGRLAAERSRNVRLQVYSPRGTEVDLGSNNELFWVWSKDNQPAAVTCKHENMDFVRQSDGIPFEPDLLMQALSVAPIPAEGVEFETAPTRDQARLVMPISSAHGRPLRRVIVVDLKKNCVVTEHSLYDYDGRPIAFAKLSQHGCVGKTGIVMPHRVELDWPKNRMSVILDLGKIEMNPVSIPSELWAMPKFPKSEVVCLDEHVRPGRIATRPGSLVHFNGIEAMPAEGDNETSYHDDQIDSIDQRVAEPFGESGRKIRSVKAQPEDDEF